MPYLSKRVGRCLKTASLFGTGIGGTAVITAYLMTKIKTENEDDTFILKDKIPDIYDLEKIVKQKAWARYKRDQTSNGWFTTTYKPVLQLDWDNVESFPEQPVFKESTTIPKKEDVINVLFQTVFQNKSTRYQQHTLRAEVETLSMCESSLTKGFTKNSKVGLSLQAPDEVTKEASVFSKGFSINHVHGNLHEMLISSVSEDIIKVPGDSKILVSKELRKVQRAYDFKTIVGFEGHVKGLFYDHDQQCIALYDIPISTIIQEFPKEMITEKNGRYYMEINGRCNFKYEIEQDAHICDASF